MDSAARLLVSRNDAAADLVNLLVFKGHRRVRPDDLQAAGESELLTADDDGDREASPAPIRPRHRDNAWRLSVKLLETDGGGAIAFGFVGIESQATVCHDMPVRILGYDAARYEAQVRHAKAAAARSRRKDKRHRRGRGEGRLDVVARGECASTSPFSPGNRGAGPSDGSGEVLVTSDEFVSGIPAGTKLVPIIDIVIYWGKGPWTGPRCLKDMLTPLPREFMALVQDYRLSILVPADLDDSALDKMCDPLKLVLGVAKYQEDRAGLTAWLKRTHMDEKPMGIEAWAVVKALGGNRFLKLFRNREEPEGRMTMCKAFDDIYEEGKAAGMEQGRSEGLSQGLSQGLEQGLEQGRMEIIRSMISLKKLSLKTIARVSSLSLDQVAEIARQMQAEGRGKKERFL